ncbi:MAG: hypothetical protein JWQ38_2847 [Flavipsychrobacter sp.]|nr:hypothetical protein [Flavipsychrobacter sp.]
MLRYSIYIVLLVCFFTGSTQAQELFVYTEPASNMPAKSVGIRLSNWMMDETYTSKINYHFIPEIMWGVNRHLMLHVEAYASNRTGNISVEGGALYAKYRFYSTDKVKRHFRMAAFGRATSNNADIHQEEIMTNGHNTGYQLGMIGTQLLHKTAISAIVYYEKALNNQGGHEFPVVAADKAINYSLSIGRLMLPRTYKSYKQTNMNLMVELLGQTLPENGKQYLDIAPSVQFIFNSQTRVDVGYKHQLQGTMLRTAPNGLLIRVEHLLFNVL